MPIYTDKRSGRLFVQFDYKRQTFKQYLPPGASRKDAQKLETKMRSDVFFQVHGMAPRNEILFEDFVQEAYLPYVRDNLSDDAFTRAEHILIAAKPFLKEKTLRSIKPADIDRFKSHRMALPTRCQQKPICQHPPNHHQRKPATVDRELSILSKLFSIAVTNDACEYNPVSRIKKPKFDNIQNKVLARDDEPLFLAAFDLAQGQTARDICILVLNTGLSQKDVLRLTAFQISTHRRTINLTRSKTTRHVEIPLNDVAWGVIAPRLAKGLLFPSEKQKGRAMLSIRTAIRGACRRAKIEPVTIRDLRRTFATRLIENKADAVTTARLLGHADLRMIHRYARSSDAMREAVNTLETPTNPTSNLPAQNLKIAK